MALTRSPSRSGSSNRVSIQMLLDPILEYHCGAGLVVREVPSTRTLVCGPRHWIAASISSIGVSGSRPGIRRRRV